MGDRAAPLSWETEVRLFSRALFAQWTGAMAATVLVGLVVLAPAFIVRRRWGELADVAVFLLIIAGVIWVAGFVVIAVGFRGRVRVRYSVTDRGVLGETVDKTVRGVTRAAGVAGVLGRSPRLLGASLLARSREAEGIRWKAVVRARYDAARHFIVLRNAWRTVAWIQCTPDNFAAVAERVDRAVAARRAEGPPAASPLPRYLLHSLLVLGSCLPLFFMVDEYGIELLAVLLVMCFALATLWLIPLFGWVVLAGLGWLAVELMLNLTQERGSVLSPGRAFRRVHLLGADDLLVLGLAGLGALYLAWLAWSGGTGRLTSMLMRDAAEE